jgi:hypothetical protein
MFTHFLKNEKEYPHVLESFTDNTHWVWEQQKLQLIFKEIAQYLDLLITKYN